MTGPDRIFLAPLCCTDPGEGRIWCEHDVWPLDDCDEHAAGVEYIRADLVAHHVAGGFRSERKAKAA